MLYFTLLHNFVSPATQNFYPIPDPRYRYIICVTSILCDVVVIEKLLNLQKCLSTASGEYLPDSARIIDGELHIPSVDLDNSAVFYCRASNSQGMDEATALLDVTGTDLDIFQLKTLYLKYNTNNFHSTALGYKPLVSVVSSAKENRREGEHIQMRCSATGMPRPLFSWKRLGSSLPSNVNMIA